MANPFLNPSYTVGLKSPSDRERLYVLASLYERRIPATLTQLAKACNVSVDSMQEWISQLEVNYRTKSAIDKILRPVMVEAPRPKQPEQKHNLQLWVEKNAPTVAKLRDPLTFEQCEKLVSEYDKEVIKEVFKSMHNYKPLLAKYVDAYLTFCNWASKRIVSNAATPTRKYNDL